MTRVYAVVFYLGPHTTNVAALMSVFSADSLSPTVVGVTVPDAPQRGLTHFIRIT